MPRILRVGLLVAALSATLVACSGGTPPSFDPTGACTTDGRAPGAYPDLESLVPKTYRGEPPVTLDSGRNCTAANLGSLASLGISEVRFAGATWAFGGERAVVLAILKRDRRGADHGHRPVRARDRRPPRAPARHRDQRTDADRGRLAGSGQGRRQRRHQQRPAGRPDPGRHRRIRGQVMMRFLLRHGAVRLIGGRAVPALMLIDLAMLANRTRKVPVVDRTLRRGVGAVQRRATTVVAGRRARRAEDPPRRSWSAPRR
jgi:hypothetical protein